MLGDRPEDRPASPAGSAVSGASASKSIGTADSSHKPAMAFQIAETVGPPMQAVKKLCGSQDADWSAADERWRMREHYETHGWLPSPIVGETKRLKKKRAM